MVSSFFIIKRNTEKDIHNKSNKISKEDLESARTRVETFLKDFVSNFENLNYNIHMDVEEGFIKIEINGIISIFSKLW